ncbi:MAG: aldehyde ferredoxin oxidoreductase N-terminal domain-containing protein, partial [Chloroflexota bacterium]|nr:aldehyde ferredoxin oxidoreductase N-terminal domain-containing protein [Chloroflexota bacterium]
MDGAIAGQVLHVNLSEKRTWTEPIGETNVKDYAGGLGTCIKLASDFIPPGVSPLSPESVFVLGAGALVGTDLPSSSRMYAVGKLPASGTVGWCGAGGYSFGAQLKYAGYDHMLGVMKDGKIILERSYGWKDAGRTEPLEPDAVMRIASVTKP